MNKRLKTTIAGLALGTLLFATPLAAAQTNVYLDNTKLDTQKPVLNINNRTMMAFRDYFEATNTEVQWDDATRTATTSSEGKDILIWPDTGVVTVNGAPATLDTPPQIVDGHIYLPLRFFGEAMGYVVDFTAPSADLYEVRLGRVTPLPPVVENPTFQVKEQAIPKQTEAADSSGYFVRDGQLMQLAGLSGKVEMRTIDMTSGAAVGRAFQMSGYPNVINDVWNSDKDIVFTANAVSQQAKSPYLGSNRPTYVDPLATLDTSLGKVPVYRTDASTNSYVVDGIYIRSEEKKLSDIVLDMSTTASVDKLADASFARSASGVTAYLVDGTLLMVGADGALLADAKVAADHVIAAGDVFYLYGTDSNGLSVGAYAADGTLKDAYTTVANTEATQVRDTMVNGSSLLILTQKDSDGQLVRYNAENGDRTSTALGRGATFESIAPANDGQVYVVASSATQYHLLTV